MEGGQPLGRNIAGNSNYFYPGSWRNGAGYFKSKVRQGLYCCPRWKNDGACCGGGDNLNDSRRLDRGCATRHPRLLQEAHQQATGPENARYSLNKERDSQGNS